MSQPNRIGPNCALAFTAIILSACGGGPSSEPNTANEVDESVEMVGVPIKGTLVMEERDGKTVFDGWFSQSSVAELDNSPSSEVISEDFCEVETLAAHADELVGAGPTTDQNSMQLQSIGESLKIESRAGEFDALVKQEVGDTTVYATEKRWHSGELPDDGVLSFDNGSGFSSLDSVHVPPLMPLVWLAPETGVLNNAASALRWEASFNESVQIKLRLSAVDFRNSENPSVVTVACNVIDDGLFTLPAEFQNQLPDDETGIVVYAMRERVQNIRNDDASLTVVQLSYPAPIKP